VPVPLLELGPRAQLQDRTDRHAAQCAARSVDGAQQLDACPGIQAGQALLVALVAWARVALRDHMPGQSAASSITVHGARYPEQVERWTNR
jgi:hypothetical protein